MAYFFSWLSHLLSIILFWFICNLNGFNTDELIKLSLLFPISLIFATLPISIGGWGIREGSLLFFSSVAGIGTEKILLCSVQFGIVLALTGIMNAIFILPLSKIRKNIS
tara:strand:+ start:5879 stop:6205 length:327 start_codon:yes stop_codon:yes gene_type:complete